jgi:hypothetical protein
VRKSKTAETFSYTGNTVCILQNYVTIIILVITFMKDVYNYMPETHHGSRIYSVAAVLYLQFVFHAVLSWLLLLL